MPPNQHQNPIMANSDDDEDVSPRPSTHLLPQAPMLRTAAPPLRRKTFVQAFAASNAAPKLLILTALIALGFGSTVGVVPAVMTDRYAHLHYGLAVNETCANLHPKPESCHAASADAQAAVANEQVISNTLTFLTGSWVGSISDEYGRKPILILGLFLSCLSPAVLVALQLFPAVSPFWYYAAATTAGSVNWFAVALSALADAVPAPEWRAPSFGLQLAGFSVGLSLAPQMALWLGHWYVSCWSLLVVVIGFWFVVLIMPETLSAEQKAIARAQREQQQRVDHHDAAPTWIHKVEWNLFRPFWELSILNRNRLFRLLSLLAFFSGMVTSGDQTLLLYYIEERLGFNDKDIALLFFTLGFFGILVQSLVLKLFTQLCGERRTVMFAFAVGAAHNVLYGVAQQKSQIYVGAAVGAFSTMAFPTISAIKANNVGDSEQGRIQGALYSVQALAAGCGPWVMRRIYSVSASGHTHWFWGPGTMFLAAGAFYVVAVLCAAQLPEEANAARSRRRTDSEEDMLSLDTTSEDFKKHFGESETSPLLP